jgi:hypothetical protein
MLWNQVFPESAKDTNLNTNDIELLNSELSTRRDDPIRQEHHYIAIQCNDTLSGEAYLSVYEQLLNQLDELTIVRFGIEDNPSVFCILEPKLMSVTRRFLERVNEDHSISQ